MKATLPRQRVGLVPVLRSTSPYPIRSTRLDAQTLLVGYDPTTFSEADTAAIVQLILGNNIEIITEAGEAE